MTQFRVHLLELAPAAPTGGFSAPTEGVTRLSNIISTRSDGLTFSEGITTNLTLDAEGNGRLYCRLGVQFAPSDLTPPPLDRGFSVRRVYEAIDNSSGVRYDDGMWFIRAGARVRVFLMLTVPERRHHVMEYMDGGGLEFPKMLTVPERRHHVMLVDRLLAGLEPLNPAFVITAGLHGGEGEPEGGNNGGSNPSGRGRSANAGDLATGGVRVGVTGWFDHQSLRNDRAEAYAATLWPGVYVYTYVARATTPGRFVAPPPKAEECTPQRPMGGVGGSG